MPIITIRFMFYASKNHEKPIKYLAKKALFQGRHVVRESGVHKMQKNSHKNPPCVEENLTIHNYFYASL